MRFNITLKRKTVENYEGANAFVMTPQLELYTAVATAGLSDQFYEKSGDRLERIRTLIAKNDAVFVAKLAVYTREQMNLRTVPMVLTAELAKTHNGDGLVAATVSRVVKRADEIAELLACYAQANGRTGTKQLGRLSKQVQKGLASAFNKFDEYQFAKYNRDTAVRLRDAIFLVHPKAKDEAQQILFDKIVRDELKTPYTWETQMSQVGQEVGDTDKQAAMKSKWEELIVSGKLGYMAMMRNLRNMLEAGVSNVALQHVCEYLSNANAVANSKQLPFRFLSAYRELKDIRDGRVGMVLDALEDAVMHSAAAIRGYDAETRVLIAADVSGSMQRPISARSTVQNYDIGLMLAMLLQTRCKHVVTGMFGSTWKTIAVSRKNILSNVMEYHKREGEVGYATNGYKVIDDLISKRLVMDKVMLFTDCQLWNSTDDGRHMNKSWKEYKAIAPNAKLYLFDLAGYGTTPLRVEQDDVHLIAGWSDKVFDVLYAIENGGSAIQVINDVTL